MRGKGHGGNVFPSADRLRYQLGNLIPHTGTKTAIKWPVFIGVISSKELAGVNEEVGYYMLQGVILVVEASLVELAGDVAARIECLQTVIRSGEDVVLDGFELVLKNWVVAGWVGGDIFFEIGQSD